MAVTSRRSRRSVGESVFDMGLLKCSVRDGMFPHERDVIIHGFDRTYEVILDENQVQKGRGDEGAIEVEIVEVDNERRAYLVELPRQVVMGGSRIWVSKDALTSSE